MFFAICRSQLLSGTSPLVTVAVVFCVEKDIQYTYISVLTLVSVHLLISNYANMHM